MNPLDYSLCDRTVTIYHRHGETVSRSVVENCYFSRKEECSKDVLGKRKETTFLMIVPGANHTVFPGDRVLEGVGPGITVEQWPGFIPAKVANLMEVSYVTPCYWEGKLCHIEAGRK